MQPYPRADTSRSLSIRVFIGALLIRDLQHPAGTRAIYVPRAGDACSKLPSVDTIVPKSGVQFDGGGPINGSAERGRLWIRSREVLEHDRNDFRQRSLTD